MGWGFKDRRLDGDWGKLKDLTNFSEDNSDEGDGQLRDVEVARG